MNAATITIAIGIIAGLIGIPAAVNHTFQVIDRVRARKQGLIPAAQVQKTIWFGLSNLALIIILGAFIVHGWFTRESLIKNQLSQNTPSSPIQPTPSGNYGSGYAAAGTTYSEDVVAVELRRLNQLTWLGLYNDLKGLPAELKKQGPSSPKFFVMQTYTKDNVEVASDLFTLLVAGTQQSRINQIELPDYAIDKDAPQFKGGDISGITIHGRNAATDFIGAILQNCYFIHLTSDYPPGAIDYYRQKYPKVVGPNDVLIWLDVGPGNPISNSSCVNY